MNTKKIIHCSVKIGLCMILIGPRDKFGVVLSSGWGKEKPITPQWKSVGNAGIVSLVPFVLQRSTQTVRQARERNRYPLI